MERCDHGDRCIDGLSPPGLHASQLVTQLLSSNDRNNGPICNSLGDFFPYQASVWSDACAYYVIRHTYHSTLYLVIFRSKHSNLWGRHTSESVETGRRMQLTTHWQKPIIEDRAYTCNPTAVIEHCAERQTLEEQRTRNLLKQDLIIAAGHSVAAPKYQTLGTLLRSPPTSPQDSDKNITASLFQTPSILAHLLLARSQHERLASRVIGRHNGDPLAQTMDTDDRSTQLPTQY